MATASSCKGRGRLQAWDSIAASATDSVLVAAKAGKKIRVVAFVINQGDTTASSVTFNSASAAIYPALKYPANGGTTSPVCESGWFETNPGEALTVTTGAGSTTGISVVYEVVSPGY